MKGEAAMPVSGRKYGMCSARVVGNGRHAGGIYAATIASPEIAATAQPGQFVMFRPAGGTTAPLLMRPFSIGRVHDQCFDIFYLVRGSGTAIMSRWCAGQVIDVVGPLGNGFDAGGEMLHALLIGGGVGAAPLVFLADRLCAAKLSGDITCVLGGRTHADIDFFVKQLAASCRVITATEDGSSGERGLVTDIVRSYLSEISGNGMHLFGCGPMPMARMLAGIADEKELQCQISLEARMACGVGACLGCVVDSSHAARERYWRVCRDGPVFNARDIDWNAVD